MARNDGKTMEQVFLEIARNHGAAMHNGKMLVSVFCDLSRNTQDQRLVRYFVECDGPAELLAAGNLSAAMQQARFQQTVKKISTRTLIPEEAASRVCNAFWCAVGGSSMVQTNRQPAPMPAQPKTQPKAEAPVYSPKAAAEPPKHPPVIPKERFLMTKKEYENGGDFFVYHHDGTRELLHFPPNAQSNLPGLPRKLQWGNDVLVWQMTKSRQAAGKAGNPLLDYSDGRLSHFVKTDFITTIPLVIGLTAAYLLAIYIGIPAVAYLVNWIMEELLSIDLLMRIDFHGFGLSALVDYYKNTYTFHFQSLWDWIYFVLLLIPLGMFALFGLGIISETWENRKIVQKEIQRRKSCPDRQ